uniref:small ribosomal subunit protein uS10m n=1 Tax=Myxine glutinosa TaxID=7769 RepID=UPI00358F48D6
MLLLNTLRVPYARCRGLYFLSHRISPLTFRHRPSPVQLASNWSLSWILSGGEHLSCPIHDSSYRLKSVPFSTGPSINASSTSMVKVGNSNKPSTDTHLFTVTNEPDDLFRQLIVRVKGHDTAVLDSYEFFVSLAARELEITLDKIWVPKKVFERFTLLKSVHIYKNHRVQYEMRTYGRVFEVRHITGSTARVFLEYIQRNLPEGVAMEVTWHRLEKLPNHILEPVWKPETDSASPLADDEAATED